MARSKKKAEMPDDGVAEAGAFLEKLVGKLTLGKLLRAIRAGEEETLATFAAKLGVSTAHLSDVEHGRRAVSPERANEWARTLGYSPAQFVELALQAQLDGAGIPLQVHLGPAATAPRASKRSGKLNARFQGRNGGEGGTPRIAKHAASSARPRKKIAKSA
jgi:transcriptional regulator with XRE-family HTH domain